MILIVAISAGPSAAGSVHAALAPTDSIRIHIGELCNLTPLAKAKASNNSQLQSGCADQERAQHVVRTQSLPFLRPQEPC